MKWWHLHRNPVRSYLKIIFWPKSCVVLAFQVLKILQYSYGLKLELALVLNENLNFEIASNIIIFEVQ